MSLGLQLVMSTVLVGAAPGCTWAHPGANPYRGDPVHALADFALPAETRRKLRELMAAHAFTDVATITRDDIVGKNASYGDLRDMHSGHGVTCHGAVDRSAWSDTRHERGLVYCADDACVIVPTICNNVSLVSRKPEDNAPIDIEPAAGPKPTDPAAAPGTSDPLDFMPSAGGDAPVLTDAPAGGGDGNSGGTSGSSGTGSGGDGGYGGGGTGGGGIGDPSGGAPIGGGDGGVVVGPGTPVSTVPEAPAWSLLLAGLALVGALRQRLSRPASGV